MSNSLMPEALSALHAAALARPGTPLQLDGMFNLRDLGGYATRDGRRTRPGRIFRADSLAHVTEADLAHLEGLGLRIICDLRTAAEIADYPDRLPTDTRHEHNPMQMNVNVMADYRRPDFDWTAFELEHLFMHMLDQSGGTFRRVFAHLAEAEAYPYLFHCAAGKDRTGVTAALLLRVAGVPDETIVDDFALSDVHIEPKLPQFRERMKKRGYYALGAEKMFRAPAAAMQATLDHLDRRYGSTTAYLNGIGVTDAEIAAFTAHFVR